MFQQSLTPFDTIRHHSHEKSSLKKAAKNKVEEKQRIAGRRSNSGIFDNWHETMLFDASIDMSDINFKLTFSASRQPCDTIITTLSYLLLKNCVKYAVAIHKV